MIRNLENPCGAMLSGGGATLKNKKAFTLAEIIITLTILGVVSTMTISHAINYYKKHETITRLKIAYNLLTTLTERSRIENDMTVPQGENPDSDDDWNTYVAPYLQIIKDCGFTGKGCFAGVNGGLYNSTSDSISTSGKSGSNTFHKVILKNGMSLAFRSCKSCYQTHNIFYIDIDGPNRGYSKLGQDVFMFEWADNNKTMTSYRYKWKQMAQILHPEAGEDNEYVSCDYMLPPSVPVLAPYVWTCVNSMQGGWYTNYRNNGLLKMYCEGGDGATMHVPNGATCGAWIINNDWKFPDEYPWDILNKKPANFQRP